MNKILLILSIVVLLGQIDATKNEFLGQYTFDAEGQEGGPYMSRIPHQPTSSSGVTIGRGYDMKERSQTSIIKHLTEAGVPLDVATTLSKGAGLSGAEAKELIAQLKPQNIMISTDAQLKLFHSTFQTLLKDVIRILQTEKVAKLYGTTNVESLPTGVLEFLTDLRYRGDFHPESRKDLMPALISSQSTNNYEEFWKAARAYCDSDMKVPKERREARKKLIEAKKEECPSGTKRGPSDTTCTSCPKGYATNVDQTGCIWCYEGTHSIGSRCVQCPRGTQKGYYDTECTKCPDGQATNAYQTGCRRCYEGTISNGAECVRCPEGTQKGYFDTGCTPCPPGTAVNLDQTGCFYCLRGTFSSDGKECKPCAEGSYSDSNYASSCTPCPPGTAINSDRTGCLYCLRGTSSSDGKACKPCPEGSYSDSNFASACKECPSGMKSNPEKTGCVIRFD